MTEHQHNVGDEVWVRGLVQEVGQPPDEPAYPSTYTTKVALVSTNVAEWFRPDTELRAPDDFKDPLDQAIVDAALHFHAHDDESSVRELNATVQAKLDAQKPRTVEEVLAGHWDVFNPPDRQQPSGCVCGYEYKLGEFIPAHRIRLLREAGLLKEDES